MRRVPAAQLWAPLSPLRRPAGIFQNGKPSPPTPKKPKTPNHPSPHEYAGLGSPAAGLPAPPSPAPGGAAPPPRQPHRHFQEQGEKNAKR